MPKDPDGYSSSDLAKPAGKRELARAEKEWRALDVWFKTTDLKAVRDELKLGSLAQAQIMVNRAVERWHEASTVYADAQYVRHNMILQERLSHEVEKGAKGNARDIVALLDRQSKLLGLDRQRDQQNIGPNIVVNVALPEPVRPALPGGDVADVVDGEVVE